MIYLLINIGEWETQENRGKTLLTDVQNLEMTLSVWLDVA